MDEIVAQALALARKCLGEEAWALMSSQARVGSIYAAMRKLDAASVAESLRAVDGLASVSGSLEPTRANRAWTSAREVAGERMRAQARELLLQFEEAHRRKPRSMLEVARWAASRPEDGVIKPRVSG